MDTALLYFRKFYKEIKPNGFENFYLTNPFSALAFLNQLSYFAPKFIDKVLQELNVIKHSIIGSEHGNKALVVEISSVVFLVFQGSDISSLKDWTTIFSHYKKNYNGLKSHAGFVKIMRTLRDDLLQSDILKSNKKLVYTGHSKGGALATLFATDILPSQIVTFGAPRIFGNISYFDRFRTVEYIRIVTSNDLVRFLPFTLPFYYRHISEAVVLPASQNKNVIKAHQLYSYIDGIRNMELILK